MKARVIIMVLPVIVLLTFCRQVIIEDGIMDEGQECFQISTPSATYFYQKEAGGFSSIIDKDGSDWISFQADSLESYPSSAANSYRGLPNLVFRSEDSGAGHPGFNKCTSIQISDNQIRTVSKSGEWEWIWSFFKDHAELEILNIDPGHAYWFLYEGTINGNYRPHLQYWGTDKNGPVRSLPDYYLGNQLYDTWHWIYFGEENTGRIFFALQREKDDLADTFSYLGNTDQGIISPDGMVVFGFGRTENAIPLLNKTGERFIIGFIDMEVRKKEDHAKVSDIMAEWIEQ